MAKSSSFDKERPKVEDTNKIEIQPEPEIIPNLEPIPVTNEPVAQTTTMTETKEIRIIFEKPTQIEFIMQNNGDKSPRILHDQKLSLSKGTIYKLPITDKTINLQTAYVIRSTSKFAELIRILNVDNGFVTVEPIIHGTIINNNDLIGNLI